MRKAMISNTRDNAGGLSPVTTGLLCWLDGRDGSGNQTIWVDRSGNGNNGTLNNFTFDGTNGWEGNGLNPGIDNKNRKVSLPTITLSSANVTLEFLEMIQENKSGAMYPHQHIVGIKGLVSSYETSYYHFFGLSTSNIWKENTRIVDSYDYNSSLAEYNMPTHYVLVFTSGMLNVYKNGVNVINKAHSVSSVVNLITPNLFYINTGDDIYGNNKVYMSRVYNRALSISEVQQNYTYEQSIIRG